MTHVNAEASHSRLLPWDWVTDRQYRPVRVLHGRITRGRVLAPTRSEARAAIKKVLDVKTLPHFIRIY